MVKKQKVFDPIPGGLLADYSTLENVLLDMAEERGKLYRVKEWRPWFYCADSSGSSKSSVKKYTFAGYQMEHGLFLPRRILLASFDRPEAHNLERPLPAVDQWRVLAVSYDPFYFHPSQFEEKMKEAFPQKYLYLEERDLKEKGLAQFFQR